MRWIVSSVGRIQVPWQTGGFTILTDVDTAERTVESCTNNLSPAADCSASDRNYLWRTKHTAHKLHRDVGVLIEEWEAYVSFDGSLTLFLFRRINTERHWNLYVWYGNERMFGMQIVHLTIAKRVSSQHQLIWAWSLIPITWLTHVNLEADRAFVSFLICFVGTHRTYANAALVLFCQRGS